MSMGTKIWSVRIDAETMEEITKSIHGKRDPMGIGEWIRRAIREKLNHEERSRRKRKKKEIA